MRGSREGKKIMFFTFQRAKNDEIEYGLATNAGGQCHTIIQRRYAAQLDYQSRHAQPCMF